MDFKSTCVVLLLSVIATMASATVCVTKGVCLQEKPSPCSCQTSNGLIDLSKVGTVSAYDSILEATRFFYNPCQTFTMGACKDALMCEQTIMNNYKTVGVPSSMNFTKCGSDTVLMYEYENKVAEVTLVCSTRKGATFKMTSESPKPSIFGKSTYKFELRSKNFCQQVPTPATTVSSTVTTPQANSTVTIPQANSTVTTPSGNTTVTSPSSNTTVTIPSSNTTVTTPSANTTVTTPSSITTVTIPSGNITLSTATTATTTESSASSTSVLPAVVLGSITVIIRSIF